MPPETMMSLRVEMGGEGGEVKQQVRCRATSLKLVQIDYQAKTSLSTWILNTTSYSKLFPKGLKRLFKHCNIPTDVVL